MEDKLYFTSRYDYDPKVLNNITNEDDYENLFRIYNWEQKLSNQWSSPFKFLGKTYSSVNNLIKRYQAKNKDVNIYVLETLGNFVKYAQNDDLRKMLLSTNNARLYDSDKHKRSKSLEIVRECLQDYDTNAKEYYNFFRNRTEKLSPYSEAIIPIPQKTFRKKSVHSSMEKLDPRWGLYNTPVSSPYSVLTQEPTPPSPSPYRPTEEEMQDEYELYMELLRKEELEKQMEKEIEEFYNYYPELTRLVDAPIQERYDYMVKQYIEKEKEYLGTVLLEEEREKYLKEKEQPVEEIVKKKRRKEKALVKGDMLLRKVEGKLYPELVWVPWKNMTFEEKEAIRLGKKRAKKREFELVKQKKKEEQEKRTTHVEKPKPRTPPKLPPKPKITEQPTIEEEIPENLEESLDEIQESILEAEEEEKRKAEQEMALLIAKKLETRPDDFYIPIETKKIDTEKIAEKRKRKVEKLKKKEKKKLEVGFLPSETVQKVKGLQVRKDKEKQKKLYAKTKMCKFILQGKKCKNTVIKKGKVYKQCRYAHEEDEIRKRMCDFGTACVSVRQDPVTGNYYNVEGADTCGHYHPQESVVNLHKRTDKL